ncbi:hypothetical protein ITG09_06820 [Vibrio cyclitrophicus]|uniref:hypothetical protein n=1 Tax=Vibrio kagoshimensis TaxID=2910244 RepID=UPI00205B0D27|nr:hypothetical protein [Vibrio cyclitrophicus]UPR53329.1 hypothetical protein ITG09_06820 [Vibrio cyclitrophicus]
MSLEVLESVLLVVGTVAACIAAVPVIKSWVPTKLTREERAILKLALSNPTFKGILEYNLEPESIVKSPYKHDETIGVSAEILELREKQLLQVLEGNFGQPAGSVWFQLTAKGYAVAKRLS